MYPVLLGWWHSLLDRHFGMKEWMSVKITGRSLLGRMLAPSEAENQPSSISTFLLAISETFSRKTRVWPKNSPPCVQPSAVVKLRITDQKRVALRRENA